MKQSKNYRLSDNAINVLTELANITAAPSHTRIIESALAAYGAVILGGQHPHVVGLRTELTQNINKRRNK